MKNPLWCAVVVLLAVSAGWLTFRRSEDKATVTIETGTIKKDTQRAVESGKELLEKTEDAIRHKSKESEEDQPQGQP